MEIDRLDPSREFFKKNLDLGRFQFMCQAVFGTEQNFLVLQE